jgi:type I restriction enzyme S subunit
MSLEKVDLLKHSLFNKFFGDFNNDPSSWNILKLEEVAEVNSGVTKGKKYKEHDPLVELPYMRVANVQDGYLDLGEIKTIQVTSSDAEKYKQVLPPSCVE